MDKYYVDKRIMEVVKESDLDTDLLAPEMYYEYIRGDTEGVVLEKWYIGDGKSLTYAYSLENTLADLGRAIHFERNKVKPIYLISYTVPPSWFDEYISSLENKEEYDENYKYE